MFAVANRTACTMLGLSQRIYFLVFERWQGGVGVWGMGTWGGMGWYGMLGEVRSERQPLADARANVASERLSGVAGSVRGQGGLGSDACDGYVRRRVAVVVGLKLRVRCAVA